MRMILVLSLMSGLGLGLCGSAWAEEGWRETTPEEDRAYRVEQSRRGEEARENWERREVARQQALGLALFGTGPAMINGMNQGMQQMQIHPYVLPPPPPISVGK